MKKGVKHPALTSSRPTEVAVNGINERLSCINADYLCSSILIFISCYTFVVFRFNVLCNLSNSRAIKRNPDVLGETSFWSIFRNDFWGTPLLHSGSHKSYRPLCTITFRFNHMLAGLSPFGFHAFNVIIHSINTGLYSATLSNVLGSKRISLLAGLMFASHPIHTEAVSGIVGRADMLCCFFFLLALNVYKRYCETRDAQIHTDCRDMGGSNSERVSAEVICQKSRQHILGLNLSPTSGKNSFDTDEYNLARRRLTSATSFYVIGFAFCVLCAMLSKEQGISVVFVCILHDVFMKCKLTFFQVPSILFQDNLSGLRRGIILNAIVCIVFISLRLYLIGMNPPTFSPSDNPASDSNSLLTRTLTFLFLPAFNFGLLLCPLTLSFDWSMGAVELITSIGDLRNIISALFYFSLLWFVSKLSLNMNSVQQSTSPENRQFIHNSPATLAKFQTTTDNASHTTPKHHSLTTFLTQRSKHSQKNENDVSNNASTCFNTTGDYKDDRWYALLLGLSILIFPFVPATNLFFYVGFVVAERVLYIPSMGFCLLIAIGIHLLLSHFDTNSPHLDIHNQENGSAKEITSLDNPENGKKHSKDVDNTRTWFFDFSRGLLKTRPLRMSDGVCVLTILLLALFSCKTLLRNEDWLTEEALYKSGISVNPAKAWGNLANVLNSRGKIREAEHAYKTALLYRNNMADVHYNLGILYQEQGRLTEAIESYERAIQCRPRLTMAHLNLGIVLATVGRKLEAEQVYRHCSDIDTSGLKDPRLHEHTKISSLYNLGRLLADLDRHEEAIAVYLKAVDRKPPQYPAQSIYNMLGESYARMGHLDKAEFYYKQALLVKADHVPAHLTLAKLYQRKGKLEDAEQLYLKSLGIDPTDYTVHQHYGQFLGDTGRIVESAESYLKAAKLAPMDFEIIFNTANALRSIGRNTGAEEFYRRATEIQPETALTHMNLGAILHFNGKLQEAERSYLRALELRPGDSLTESNLGKLRSLMEKKRNSQQTHSNDVT